MPRLFIPKVVAAAASFAVVLSLAVAGSGQATAKVFDPRTFTLANGLKVVVIEHHRLPVVRQMVFYRVGSADDPPGKSGLAHYLEHLMFKGTKKLGPNEFSRIVARNGGRENAYTSFDTTAYYQTVAKDRLELIIRLEADRMANLAIDPKEAVPELEVVREERRSRTDNRPAAQLDEQTNAALYLNHPYRVPIIGWMHELEGLTVGDAVAFYKRFYAPNNAILVIAGDVTIEEVRPLAEKYYGPIPNNPGLKARKRLAEPPQRAARRVSLKSGRVREPNWGRDYLAPSRPLAKGRMAEALEVLDVILGSGATSRLHRVLVLDKKLALGIGSYYDADALGPAAFGFSARPRAGVKIATLEAAVDAEIERLLAGGVTDDEVATAKTRLLAGAIFARESLRRGANAIGTALTTGQSIEAVETWPQRIEAVTAADILAAARHVLQPARSVTGVLLPADHKKSAAASKGSTVGGGKPKPALSGGGP